MKTDLLVYLLHTSVSITVFYLAYWLFVKNTTHFSFSRAYLVLSICLSLTLPFINFPQLSYLKGEHNISPALDSPLPYNNVPAIESTPLGVEKRTVPRSKPSSPSFASNLTAWLLGIYLTGTIIFSIRLIFMLIKVWSLYRSARFETLPGGTRLGITAKTNAPFSFCNLLFVPTSTIPSEEFHKILVHERTHIQQYHTVDLLLVEVLIIIQWYNPMAWLVKKALQDIHEYLADEGVIQDGSSLEQYQMLLLNYSMGREHVSLANTFARHSLKKRILMMNKTRSSPAARWNNLALFPLVIILLTLWAKPIYPNLTVNEQGKTRDIFGTVNHIEDGKPLPGIQVKVRSSGINATTNEEGFYRLKDVPRWASEVVFIAKEYDFIVVPLVPSDSLVDVNLSQSYLPSYRKNSAPGWYSSSHQPIRKDPQIGLQRIKALKGQPLYVIDGQPVKGGNPPDLAQDQIKSFNILKGQTALALYGSMAKNGAIVISTYRYDSSSIPKVERRYNLKDRLKAVDEKPWRDTTHVHLRPNDSVYVQDMQNHPLVMRDFLLVYVIDDKIYRGEPFYLTPGEIESMEVIRKPEIAKEYGVDAGGIIRIQTKKEP